MWRAFNGDVRMTCYNEPFNPQIMRLHNSNFKEGAFYRDYLDLIDKDGRRFWSLYSPIENIYELKEGFSNSHKRYLEYLAESSDCVLIEMTRVHFKLADLKKLFPSAVLVHVYRPASSFASSVMLPNPHQGMGGRFELESVLRVLRRKIARIMHKARFWSAKYSGNRWDFDLLMGDSCADAFASLLAGHDIDCEVFYGMPAIGRLLAYWKVAFATVEQDGKNLFGEKFISLNFNDFCSDPEKWMQHIYQVAAIESVSPDLSWVHKANRAYDHSNKQWSKYASKLGIDHTLI